jgi:hypothetical protein
MAHKYRERYRTRYIDHSSKLRPLYRKADCFLDNLQFHIVHRCHSCGLAGIQTHTVGMRLAIATHRYYNGHLYRIG